MLRSGSSIDASGLAALPREPVLAEHYRHRCAVRRFFYALRGEQRIRYSCFPSVWSIHEKYLSIATLNDLYSKILSDSIVFPQSTLELFIRSTSNRRAARS